jgi:glutamate synthase domain-containing protein 3
VDDSRSPTIPDEVVLSVQEIRDYRAINAEIVRSLARGCRMIRLAGVRGERLLASGLDGPWDAVVDIDGDVGPEVAAGVDAPTLTIVCRGRAADGGASGLRAGRLLVLGGVGTAFGYAQRGGLAVAAGEAGARAGLCQAGGDLVLLGGAGPMVGERQSGGRIFAFADRLGRHAGRGNRGGRLIGLSPGASPDQLAERAALREALAPVRPWLGSALGSGPGGDATSSAAPGHAGSWR